MLMNLLVMMMFASAATARHIFYSQVTYGKTAPGDTKYKVRAEVGFEYDYYESRGILPDVGDNVPVLDGLMNYYVYRDQVAIAQRDARFQDLSVATKILRMEVSEVVPGDYIIAFREFEVEVTEQSGPALFVFKACCRPLDLLNVDTDRAPLVMQAWIESGVLESNEAVGLIRNDAVVGVPSSFHVPTLLDGGSVTLSPEGSSGLTSSAPQFPPTSSPGAFSLDARTNAVCWTPDTAGKFGVSMRLSVPGSHEAFTTFTYITQVHDLHCPAPYDGCTPSPILVFNQDDFPFRKGLETSYEILADGLVPGVVELLAADLPAGATIDLRARNVTRGTALYSFTWAPDDFAEDTEVCFSAITDTNMVSLGKYCVELEVLDRIPCVDPFDNCTPAPVFFLPDEENFAFTKGDLRRVEFYTQHEIIVGDVEVTSPNLPDGATIIPGAPGFFSQFFLEWTPPQDAVTTEVCFLATLTAADTGIASFGRQACVVVEVRP